MAVGADPEPKTTPADLKALEDSNPGAVVELGGAGRLMAPLAWAGSTPLSGPEPSLSNAPRV
jgi:hypothetical protein